MKIKKKADAPSPAARAAAPAPKATVAAPSATLAGTQYRRVEDLIRPDTIAYLAWKEWNRARERADFPFLWQMSTEDGPLREAFGPLVEFPDVCRRKLRPIAGIHEAELRKIRLNGPSEAHILQVYGHKERERRDYTAERWVMLRTRTGWRLHQIDAIRMLRTEKEFTALGFEDFAAVTLPKWFQDTVVKSAELAQKKKAFKVET